MSSYHVCRNPAPHIYGVSVNDDRERYHYVYRITSIVSGTHYYGCRSSKTNPLNDIARYKSSSKSKPFQLLQKVS